MAMSESGFPRRLALRTASGPHRAALVLIALLSPLFVAACASGGGNGGDAAGGGGDGSSLPPGFFETEEFEAGFALDALNASSAYAEGGTGEDVKVAVIDTGIDVDHPEFAGAIAAESINIADGSADIDDVDGHGTAVSGIIGARRNGDLTHGVAFDAELLVVRADEVGSCLAGCAFQQSDVAAATDYAVAQGARVINYSVGGVPAISPALENALARAVDAGVVVVFAAGNDGGAEPTLPARFAGGDRADGRAIAVGAVDANTDLAAFSNRAGDAKDAFVVAPGVGVLAPARGGGTGLFTGTSFAAPHISGAAAIVLDAAPFLSPDEAVALLLETATDLGEPGVDEVYGHGLVNLAAALSPQGTLSVPLGESVADEGAPVAASGLVMGPAFGPGPDVARAIFLDGYGRPFWLELDDRVRADRRHLDLLRWLAPATPVRTLAAPLDGASSVQLSFVERSAGTTPVRDAGRGDGRLDAFSLTTELGGSSAVTLAHGWGIGHRFGLAASSPQAGGSWLHGAPLRSPYLALTDGGAGVALDHRLAPGLALRVGVARDDPSDPAGLDRGPRRAAIVELARSWEDGAVLSVHLGSLAEQTSLLDSTGGGALALDGAATNFLGVGARIPVGERVALFGQLSYGATSPSRANGGLITEVSRLHSMAFAGGLGYADLLASGDRFAVTIAQPLRVEAGRASFDLPVGRTFEGEILRRREEVDLAPDGRELDLELAYRRALSSGRAFSLSWLTQLQPGHDASAPPAHAIALKWRTRF